MTEATLLSGLEDTGLPRRGMILKSLGLAGGALATVPLVALVGAMIKKPGDQLFHTLFEPNKKLFPEHRRPGAAGAARTGARSARTTSSPAASPPCSPASARRSTATTGLTAASSPTLLIRLRPGQTVKSRKGQAGYGWPPEAPEYVAYSKICTHAGCPASLYEQQTSRLLCPCHQSQFEVLQDAKPVFGPATRSLPKLPLDV